MTKIIIQITGERASGKTVTLRAIAELLKNLGCRVEIIDQRRADIDIAVIEIPRGGHAAIIDWTNMVKPTLRTKGILR